MESLKSQVDVAGGYVVIRKFDAISRERPLLEVISAFSDLCLLISEKNSREDLGAIANSLVQAFGSDMSVLARLLPNLCLILPQLKTIDTYNCIGDDQMNIQSVSLLTRFLRVVSSASHPVLLFLDVSPVPCGALRCLQTLLTSSC